MASRKPIGLQLVSSLKKTILYVITCYFRIMVSNSGLSYISILVNLGQEVVFPPFFCNSNN